MSRLAGLLLLGALAVLPFLNGGVSDAAWAVVAAATAAASIGLALRSPGPGLLSIRGASRAWWIALAACAALQILPLPAPLLRLLSPARADLADAVATVTAVPGQEPGSGNRAAPLSLHPEATLSSLAQIATLAVLFALLTQRVRRPAPPTPLVPIPSLVEPGRTVAVQARPHSRSALQSVARALHPARPLLHDLLLPALILAATVQASLVLVQYAARLSGSARDLPFGLGILTGTYINRNGLGNLLALILPVTAGLLLARLRRAGERAEGGSAADGRGRFRALLKSGAGWLLVALALQSAGVVLSLSRGAMAAAAVALGLLLLAAGLRYRAVAGPLAVWGVPLLFALAVGSYLGLDTVLARWASLEKDPEGGRLEWWGAAWGLFRACPVLGAGLGGYLDGADAFRGPAQPFYHAEHAHNDYAEALAVLGVPGGLLALAALALAGFAAARAVRRGSLRRMGLAAGLFAFAAHAAVDFPLAYGANVAWAVALWALLVRPGRRDEADRLREERSGRRRRRGGKRTPYARLLPFAALGVTAAASLAAYAPILAAVSEVTIAPARGAARAVRETGAPEGAKGKTGEAWRGAFSAPLAAATETAGGRFRRAEAHRLVATLLGARAAGDAAAGLPAEETAHARRRALAASAAALRLRPALAEAWAEHAALLRAAATPPSPTESAPTRVGGGSAADPPGPSPAERAPTRVGGHSLLRASGASAGQAVADPADLALETATRLAPASPRIALREAVYWLARARTAPRGAGSTDASDTPTPRSPEPGTAGDFRLRSQKAYRRLLAVSGIPAPERFLRDAWRRGGSVDFMLGCIPRTEAPPGDPSGTEALAHARRLLELAVALVTNEGRLDEIEKAEQALDRLPRP
jgi:O-antigen ligase